MLRTTQLHDYHAMHGKLTEFAGYDMPLWYTTTTEEHLAVRRASGIFDVSHMGRFVVDGEKATGFLEGLVPTSVGSQQPGKAFYTLLLNDGGGIIDDLIIERLTEDAYMVVVNAANAKTDMRHMKALAPPGLEIDDRTDSTAMIAVQGPKAAESLQPLTELDLGQLKRFRCSETRVAGQRSLVSRTGYTGEDGFEVIVFDTSNERPGGAMRVWEALAAASAPCGLGARDSLRLEAGFPLHGSDIDQSTNPYQADLGWVISSGKTGFVGSEAIAGESAKHPQSVRRGLELDSGIPRHGFSIEGPSGKVGTVTSGGYSPLIKKGIALCMVDQASAGFGTRVGVKVRGAGQEGTIKKPPFYDEKEYGWKRGKGN